MQNIAEFANNAHYLRALLKNACLLLAVVVYFGH
jgi:hypothetical protein